MDLKNKIIKLLIPIFYILVNIIYYESIFIDLPNIFLFLITLFLLIFEILFYRIFIIDLIGIKSLELREFEKKIIVFLFITVISGIGFSRILLHSSPYFNDYLNTNVFLIYFIGGIRVFYIFMSILMILISKEIKNLYFIFSSILNFLVSIMTWIDFDININGILRIVIGILYIIFLIRNKSMDIVS